MHRLRTETRADHEAVERAVPLMVADLTLDVYRRTLARFRGYYAPLERALHKEHGDSLAGLNLDDRWKVRHLDADLVALGCHLVTVRECVCLPPVASEADALGCLYVVEGASLGGQLISRHVHATLGLTPECGLRFFTGYGERTGAMWRAFGEAVATYAHTEEATDRMVRAARETFRTFRVWLETGEETG